jgi:hypothetical protein
MSPPAKATARKPNIDKKADKKAPGKFRGLFCLKNIDASLPADCKTDG